VINLRKIVHGFVALMFALAGVSAFLDVMGSAWHLRTVTGAYFRTELDILEGILFLGVAVGIYRFESRVRIFATILAGLNTLALGIAMITAPGILAGVWFLVWLLVFGWLLSPTVRGQFHFSKVSKTTA
jgi:hypothetical protein